MTTPELKHPLLEDTSQKLEDFETRPDLKDQYYQFYGDPTKETGRTQPLFSVKVRSFPEKNRDETPPITSRKISVGILSAETGLNKWGDLVEIDIACNPEGNITDLDSLNFTYYPDPKHHYLLSYKPDEKNPAIATLTRVADIQTGFENASGRGTIYREKEEIDNLKLPETLCPKRIDWIGTAWMYASGFNISGERALTREDIRQSPLLPATTSPFIDQQTIFQSPTQK